MLPATQTAPGTVIMQAIVSDVFGGMVPAGALEPRIISNGNLFEVNGRNSLRAGTGQVGSVTMNGNLMTATFTGLSQNDLDTVAAADSAVLWLGRDGTGLTEATMSEYGEIPGPDPGCNAPTDTPDVPLTPSPLSFGNVAVGQATVGTLVLTNADADLTVDDIAIGGPVGLDAGDFSVIGTTCGSSLAPGASCQISVRMTATAAGARWASIGVSHSGANASSRAVVTGVALTPPTISSVAPDPAGHGATVRISGTNLASTTLVRIGGVGAAFTVVNDGAVDVVVPGAALIGADAVDLQTAGGSATSVLTVTPPAPTISGVAPLFGAPGDVVMIVGTNFDGLQSVRFNTTPATVTSSTNTQIVTSVPAGATTGRITVTTAGGAVISTAIYAVDLVPVVTSFNPTTARPGRSVTITGTGFGPQAQLQVRFNGALGTITAATATSITVTIPNNATQGPVTVTNTVPFARTGSSNGFTVEAAPTITSLAPAAGAPRGATITITGTNLLGTTKVQVNGKSATNVVVVSPTTVTATIPSNATTGRSR